jgi:Ca2+-binding RTX toxin-like protein
VNDNHLDVLRGGDGDDLIESDYDGSPAEIHGGIGSDTLFGDAGDDELHGDAGDDELFGGGGTDALDGGADNDRCDSSGASTETNCET